MNERVAMTASDELPRDEWVSPQVERIAAGSAENGGINNSDGIGFS